MTKATRVAAPPPDMPSRVGAVPRPRIAAVDVLRGFALCGILLVNIEPVTQFRYAVPHPPSTLHDPSGWLQLAVQQRFFPIFSLLFGIGFSIFLASLAGRVSRPRVLLVRRLLVLLGLGALHQLIHPGEALLIYAAAGLLILLPSTWLPVRLTAVLAVAFLAAGLLLAGGGFAMVPGLFLLGSVLVRSGVIDRVTNAGRTPLLALSLFALPSAAAVIWQLQDLPDSGFTAASAVAGLLLAGCYVTGVLTLLHTPLRRSLEALFTPLGRMALTNYVTATGLMLLAKPALDLPHAASWAGLLLTAAAILVLQWGWSYLWLRRFRHGPLEWAWRCATWGRKVPLRR